jgi:hypothetical protein
MVNLSGINMETLISKTNRKSLSGDLLFGDMAVIG